MAKSKGKSSDVALGGSATHLLHRVLQLALDFHSAAAGDGGLTQRQFAVLTAAAAGGDGMTQSQLVRATGIDRSTLADLVARLTAKGLLAKSKSASDGRANSVAITEAGEAALKEGRAPASLADDRLLALLPAKRRSAFLKALTTLSEAADGKPAKAAKAAVKAPKGDKPKKKKKKAKKAAQTEKPESAG